MSEKWVPRELILAHLEMYVVYFTCNLQNLNKEKNPRAFSVDERLISTANRRGGVLGKWLRLVKKSNSVAISSKFGRKIMIEFSMNIRNICQKITNKCRQLS